MFNPVQMQEALKNPAITGQRLGAYQTPNSPNPQVRPDDAKAEETRRAQLVQSAMGQQAAAMGDPSQTPSILAQTMMENQQLKKMLASMQQRQQPMMVPQARGLESLPAPAVERGYAGGGIVAFEDGGKVERYQSQGLVSPPGGFVPPVQRMIRGVGDLFSQFNKEGEPQLDVIRLRVLQEKIDNGTATPQEQTLYAQLKQKLASPTAPTAAAQRPPSVGDVAALGLDRGLPAAAAEVRQKREQNQGAGVAELRPTGRVDTSSIGMDFPSAAASPASAGLLGAAQNMAAQEQAPVGPELTQEAKLRQSLAARRTLMQELGLSGGAGDELRAQAEEMKAAQAKYKEQAGLAGLANVLAAYGSAPRKRAAGAAGQAAAQFVSGQQDAERKFEMDMAALKASATRADRAEKRGDLDAVMKENQFQETIKAEMDRIRTQLESREKEGAAQRSLEERLAQNKNTLTARLAEMDDTTKREISKASLATQVRIAEMPTSEFRTLQALSKSTGKPILDLMQMSSRYGKQEVTAADRARFIAAYNDLPRSERAKYNDVEDFINQMSGGAGGMPSGVTVKKKD